MELCLNLSLKANQELSSLQCHRLLSFEIGMAFSCIAGEVRSMEAAMTRSNSGEAISAGIGGRARRRLCIPGFTRGRRNFNLMQGWLQRSRSDSDRCKSPWTWRRPCHEFTLAVFIWLLLIPGAAFCGTPDAEKQILMDHFHWETADNGKMATALFTDNNFSMLNLTSSEFVFTQTSLDLALKLADIAGIKINSGREAEKTLRLVIFTDSNIMTELREVPEKFRGLGIPQMHIDSLISATSVNTHCYVSSMIDKHSDITISYVLDATNSQNCVKNAIYYAFGITHLDSDPNPDLSLCILYASMRIGSRTREDVVRTFDSAKEMCKKYVGDNS